MQRGTPSLGRMMKRAMEGKSLAVKLQFAAATLGLDMKRFNRIITSDLKKEMLAYRLVRKELEIYATSDLHDQEDIQLQLAVCKECHDLLLASKEVVQHSNTYSSYSKGLQILDSRTAYTPLTQQVPSASNMLKSVMNQSDIPAGVEPKFKAMLLKDPLMCLFNSHPDQRDRWEFIVRLNGNPDKIAEHFDKHIPHYMFKLVHEQLDDNHKTRPKAEDLARSRVVKRYKQIPVISLLTIPLYQALKSVHINELNASAVMEVLANDVARAAGMTVQAQELYPGMQSDGVSQLLLHAQLLQNATDLGGMDGANIQGGSETYIATPLIIPRKNQEDKVEITHVSDTSIKNLGEKWAILVTQGDRDGIGSAGQNKMRMGDEFVGIDFGKAYQHTVANQVTADFRLSNPDFKNYTIFNDVPRSEKVKGLLILAKLLGKLISPAIVESHGIDFKARLETIIPHAAEMIFNDYLNYFDALKNECGMSASQLLVNLATYEEVIKAVTLAKKNGMHSMAILLDKYKDYLAMPMPLCDLLENIERVVAGNRKTSMRSPDRKVLLRHLRVTENSVQQWTLLHASAKGYQLQAVFLDKDKAQKAIAALTAWMNAANPDLIQQTHFVLTKDGKLDLHIQMDNLKNICEIFAEDDIKRVFHPDDLSLQLCCDQEMRLRGSHSILADFGIKATLRRLNQGNDAFYQLALTCKDEKLIPYAFVEKLKLLGFDPRTMTATFSAKNEDISFASEFIRAADRAVKTHRAAVKQAADIANEIAIRVEAKNRRKQWEDFTRKEWPKRWMVVHLLPALERLKEQKITSGLTASINEATLGIELRYYPSQSDAIWTHLVTHFLAMDKVNNCYLKSFKASDVMTAVRKFPIIAQFYHDYQAIITNTKQQFESLSPPVGLIHFELTPVGHSGEFNFSFQTASPELKNALQEALKEINITCIKAEDLLRLDIQLIKALENYTKIKTLEYQRPSQR